MLETGQRRLPGNLPVDLTSFVGRRREVAEVKRLLSASRLVTLTGVGGVGKTKLALRVARSLRRAFQDGVWLVSFAQLREPRLVAAAVLRTLEPEHSTEPSDAVVTAQHLQDKRLLLVLDNCEHLVGACAVLVDELLHANPKLHILATSREPLGVIGEHTMVCSPMSVPDSDDASTKATAASEAVALFVQRASAILPEFVLNSDNEQQIAEVCRRMDGLPLAIELAAGRMGAMSVRQLLDRLDDRHLKLATRNRVAPLRHHTMRAAIDWSFDLCTEEQRRLWARLSVLPGGFAIDTAEHVCSGDGIAAESIVELVDDLVDRSMLVREEHAGQVRLRMLDTMRRYASERLREYGEETTLLRRHRDHYLHLVERAGAEWFGPHQQAWSSRLRSDHRNLCAALEYCATQPGEAALGLRMAGALGVPWIASGELRAAGYWMDRLLALADVPHRDRAQALWVGAAIALAQGESGVALAMLDEGRALMDQDIGADSDQLARMDGWAALIENDPMRAVASLSANPVGQEAEVEFVGDFCRLALFVTLNHEFERAVALCQKCIAICEDQGEQWTRSWALGIRGLARWLDGDSRRAITDLRECLRIKRALRDPVGIDLALRVLAWAAATQGEAERAARLLGAGRHDGRSAAVFDLAAYRNFDDACERQVRELLGDQALQEARQQGAQLSASHAVAYALGERSLRATTATAPATSSELTRREEQVAELVAQGLSNKAIAATLVIAKRTADAHVEHILLKLGFTSRSQIATWITGHRTPEVTPEG